LLKKFLVRDPIKRSSLEILVDDPWINESYNDSPISTDKSEQVEEDESIIKIMEAKYKFDKSAILQALRENIYNDISAIYFLLYYDKDTKTSIEQDAGSPDITKISNPNPKKESMTAGEKEKAMPKIGEDEVFEEEDGQVKATLSVPADNAATRSNSTGANKTVVAAANSAAATVGQGAAVSGARRKRAATVTIESAGGSSSAVQPIPTSHTATQSEKPQPANPAERPATAVVAGEKKTAENDNDASSATTAAQQQREIGIKRNNTITGIIRGLSQRRGSEATDHPEADDNTDKPRSLRFTFNSNTTSSKSPDEIMVELVKASNKLNLVHRLLTRYLIECSSPSSAAGKESLKVEVEVCKLPRLNNLHGLRFKRVSGSSADYKEVCEQILASIHL
jgi:MAP/microtubule affinity-regulating kinase